MKKILIACIITSAILLSSCSFPWGNPTNARSEAISAPEDALTDEDVGANITTVSEEASVDITPSDTPKGIAEGGVYLPFTTTALAQARGSVVLFFCSNWSPACDETVADIRTKQKDIPKDVTILYLDYDTESELNTRYDVTTQHTFVQVDNTGKLIKKWRGTNTLNEIISQVQK